MRKILASIVAVLLIASCLFACSSCSFAELADGVDIVLGASVDTVTSENNDTDGEDVVFVGTAIDEDMRAYVPVIDVPDETPATKGLHFKLLELGYAEDGSKVRAYSVVGYNTLGMSDKEVLPADVYVPYSYNDLPVVEIAPNAFDNTKINSITLPKTLLKISDKAFRNSGVATMNLPASLLSIADNAFIGCKNLTAPTLEEGSARYSLNGPYLMDGTVLVRAFGNGTIDASVTEIAPNAFNGCGALTEITVPATVATIGHSAFADCPKLVSAVIETPITATVSRMFDGCRSLIEVTLPDTVTEYAHATFRNTGFVTFTVPANVQVIGTYAFAETERLTNIYFNEGLKVVGGYAFANATALTELMLPNGTEKIGGTACTGCTSLARVRIAPTVTYIGDGAFYGCFFLKSLYIPKSVTYLGGLILYGVEKSTVISIESTFAGASWASNWNCYLIENAQESGKIPTVINYLTVKKGAAAPDWYNDYQ